MENFLRLGEIYCHPHPPSLILPEHLVHHQLGVAEYSQIFDSEFSGYAKSCQQGFVLVVGGIELESEGTMDTVALRGNQNNPAPAPFSLEAPSTYNSHLGTW